MSNSPGERVSANHLQQVRRVNRALVLKEIKSSQPVSRAELASRLSMGKSTVSLIVEELVARKLVLKLGERPANGSRGRPAPLFGFNPKSAYGIGVDIGGTKIQVLVTDLAGDAIYTERFPTTNSVTEIVALVRGVLNAQEIPDRAVLGMGVGVPGTTREGVVVRAKALSWTNLDLKTALAEHFSFPVFINNDVNNAALGERWQGSAEFADDLFFISIGTGIGSAIIADGNLVYGATGRAGEITYQLNRSDLDEGNVNVLGQHGVLERRVSGYALSQSGVSPEQLFQDYSIGEETAVQVIDDMIAHLSVTIANAVSLLNPGMVVIGGGIADSMHHILGRIKETVAGLTPIPTIIRLASLGSMAGAYGAVALAIDLVEHGDFDPREGDAS